MLVEEMPRSFVKKNNSYSHCPLKKRPVHVMLYDEVPEAVKEEIIDVVTDDIPEPENLSTKPEDLSKASKNRATSPSSTRSMSPPMMDIESAATPIDIVDSLPMSHHNHHHHHHNHNSETPHHHLHHHHHHHQQQQQQQPHQHQHQQQHHQHEHHHQQHQNVSTPVVSPIYHQSYPSKSQTPPLGSASVYPIVKKERLEIIQHDGGASSLSQAAPGHFVNSKTTTTTTATTTTTLEPLNLNAPIEPIPHYPTPAWSRVAPLYPPHYLPYPAAYRFPHHHHHPGAELYPSYPVPSYPHSSPEHPSVSPQPHAALTCPTIQRPIARSYAHWANSTSPDHCGLSPTSSLGYGSSLRSPPPVTPEDLSSPGSDSGRSSAGSTSAGTSLIGIKIDGQTVCTSQAKIVGSSSSSSSTSSTASPRYQCPDCAKSYSTYSGLSKHQQFHCAAAEGQTKKSFSCKYCEKVYVSMGALKMHIRTHTLPCKCHLCGKAFSRPWLLQGHIRTHTGEKPFSCQHCNRAFADRSNLRAHLQTHSDVKKYSCASCSKTFSRMSLLTKHQEGGCPGMAVPIGYTC